MAELTVAEERKCLFCDAIAPSNIPTSAMTYRHWRGWYSNGLMNKRMEVVARFYVCPHHRGRIQEAWEWARKSYKRQRNGGEEHV